MSTMANVLVSDVCEDSEEEIKDSKPHRYSQTVSMKENLNLKPEEIHQQARLGLLPHRSRSLDVDDALVEEEREESMLSLVKSGSESSDSPSKQMPHQAYWTEQQNRLPLPLMELMENEVLDILNKALGTYKSTIGRNHFMTKQLQGYIEELRKRRNRRLNCTAV